jgi:hypothetical protein
MLSMILFLVIIAIGVVAYVLGRNNGYAEGRDHGFVQGKSEGVQLWQQVLEARRGPDGKDAFLGVRR